MTEDHIAVLKYVAAKQPMESWRPKERAIAEELIAAGLIRATKEIRGSRRSGIYRDVGIDLSGRLKIKEWQDAIDEKKLPNRILKSVRQFGIWIGIGIGFIAGGFLGVVGSETARKVIDQLFSKETTPILQETLPKDQSAPQNPTSRVTQ
jgi:hypothetical protein